jgi:hypothetical protein
MLSGSRLLWDACGRPAHPEARDLGALPDSRCWVCAGDADGRGLLVAEWDGAKFTGQTRVRYPRGQVICECCLWVMARKSDVPGRPAKPGQDCGPNWRNFSVLYRTRDDGSPDVLIASKGEKPAIRAWLRTPRQGPWFAALADTGQKHVVPWVPVAAGKSGVALFDEVSLRLPAPDDAVGWRVLDDLMALLTAGATKEEVDAGAYTPGTLIRCEPLVRAFERNHGHMRGGGWFALVVFLAQRDEEAVTERMEAEAAARKTRADAEKAASKRPAPPKTPKTPAKAAPTKTEETHGDDSERDGRAAGNAHERPAAGGARAVPRSGRKRAQALGADQRPDARGDAHAADAASVVHQADARPPALDAQQLNLFGA